jgi:Na+-transporting NADH:ubiquinone oxidoreductase subunit NqrB
LVSKTAQSWRGLPKCMCSMMAVFWSFQAVQGTGT